ncbi:MAG TPA: TetR family transcriptional regulator [Acidimicrobiales bacterium]
MAGTRWNQSEATRRTTPQVNITRRVKRPTRVKGPFTISELAERTGIRVPTIHYYHRLGLLPEPTVIAANRFHYDERHVEALAMIRILREERQMSLASIAEVLPDLLPDGQEEAFRPEMWDQVVAAHLEDAALSEPPARLLMAAREAFAQDGYARVNIADICDAAEVAKGSFYRHFETKDAIFLAAVRSVPDVIADELDELGTAVSAGPASALLEKLLEPYVSLLLEATMRERRGSTELTGVTAELMRELADRLQPHLRPGKGLAKQARLVVRTAVLALLHDALGLDAT